MVDTVKCQNPEGCISEGAFFNGVCYECPECDYEWSDADCKTDEEE